MNPENAATDQVVRMTLAIIETAARLMASGAVNLATLLIAATKNKAQISDLNSVYNLIENGKQLASCPLEAELQDRFTERAKEEKLTFSTIREPNKPDTIEIVFAEDDVAKVNKIRESIGATAKVESSKKAAAGPSVSESQKNANSITPKAQSTTTMTKSLEQQAEIMLNRLSVIRSHLDNGVPADECHKALLKVRDEVEALLIEAQTREKTGEKDSKQQNAQRADGKSQTRSEGKGGKKSIRDRIAAAKERMAHQPQHLRKPQHTKSGPSL